MCLGHAELLYGVKREVCIYISIRAGSSGGGAVLSVQSPLTPIHTLLYPKHTQNGVCPMHAQKSCQRQNARISKSPYSLHLNPLSSWYKHTGFCHEAFLAKVSCGGERGLSWWGTVLVRTRVDRIPMWMIVCANNDIKQFILHSLFKVFNIFISWSD